MMIATGAPQHEERWLHALAILGLQPHRRHRHHCSPLCSTRALSLGSLEEDDVAKGGDVSDFTEAQRKMVADQHEFYLGKYPRVGKIKSPYYGFK